MKILSRLLVLGLVGIFIQAKDNGTESYQDLWVVPDSYKNMKNPYANDSDPDRIGKLLYTKNCKLCHGKKGAGDGPNAKLIEVPVADFTSESFKQQSDGSIYYKISQGRELMPKFESLITEEEDMWLLVNYIRKM